MAVEAAKLHPIITLTHVLSLVSWLVGGTAAYFDAIYRVAENERRVEILEKRADSGVELLQRIFDTLTDLKVDIAAIKARTGDESK